MKEFDGQVAVVTGGARGIGAEIARRLARGGARVVCADVLDTTDIVAEINDAGGAAEGRELNVTDAQAAAESIKAVHEAHGRLDILVNNAGVTRDKLLVRMKPEDWDLVLDINLDGVFKVTQPAAKLMMRQRSGRIVNIASVVGLMGNELGPRNVTVNAVAPGYIQTPMTDKLTEEQREMLLSTVAIPRLGTPEDVAEAVAFLAGPGAAYITGVVLNISGGLYI